MSHLDTPATIGRELPLLTDLLAKEERNLAELECEEN
jgi:hypothetical protein